MTASSIDGGELPATATPDRASASERRPPARVIEHSALSSPRGVPLRDAELTDRQRIAVLFQCACLLAHLEPLERSVGNWHDLTVDSSGGVSGLGWEPRPPGSLAQVELLELVRELFQSEAAPAGRGEARRVARSLYERWRQSVIPLSAVRCVEQLLDEARFLWRPEFAWARSALACRLGGATAASAARLEVLGTVAFARTMKAGVETLEELREKLVRSATRRAWLSEGAETGPRAHFDGGRWWTAVRAWELAGASTSEERFDFARSLHAVGRFEDALDQLKGLRRPAARLLKLWCLYRLGRLGAARRELDAVAEDRLDPRQRAQLLAVTLRVLENRGEADVASRLLKRALAETSAETKPRIELLAAVHAWDRGRLDEMRRSLARVRETLDSPDSPRGVDREALLWRWHKTSGLEAVARGDGAAAVEHFAEALGGGRRRQTPFEAGALWNELAMGRALEGDLAGAEKALGHTLRLHRDVQGSRPTTSLLFNLAEIRVRRGRLDGVSDILSRATAEDRRARNWRSLAHDHELWSRFELARGRPHAALLRARDGLDELEQRGVGWRVSELHLLAARALGWLERSEAARRELDLVSEEAFGEIEPEEVPAVWALAGDRERALAQMPAGPLSPLWSQLLTGVELGAEDWRALQEVEPYRAARFVFDSELVVPGCAPPAVLRRAVVSLREAGCDPLAERLDERDSSTWRALGRYLEAAPSGEALEALFLEAGYPEVRLVETLRGDERVLHEGRGGDRQIARSTAGKELVLSAPAIDDVLATLLAVVATSLEPRGRTEGRPAPEIRQRARSSRIVGESRPLRELLDRAARLAAAPVPVLILGETGTGKELLAREVHDGSPRSAGAFVTINCAAVSEELLMSDLFGHVRGSFTGATRDRVGVFETARGGTVFLDEIGDLPLRAQGFLLRVLQEGEVRRVGETLPRKTDVRVVAATNRDLEAMVSDGGFRADLYYRLRVGALELPPLRHRAEDILSLAEHFLALDAGGLKLDDAAAEELSAYEWPGNIRELRNVLAVAAAYADDGVVGREHLDLPYRSESARRGSSSPPAGAEASGTIGYHESVLNYRRNLLREALEAAGGNRAKAARRVGLTRQALSYLVVKLGLDV